MQVGALFISLFRHLPYCAVLLTNYDGTTPSSRVWLRTVRNKKKPRLFNRGFSIRNGESTQLNLGATLTVPVGISEYQRPYPPDQFSGAGCGDRERNGEDHVFHDIEGEHGVKL